ncbi:MAG: hypothetical protein SVM86_00150 [Candidatus Cloacimonadota bacterium]|nr:hypothetical protein [Candidatus Cloacimonadota bacterium]
MIFIAIILALLLSWLFYKTTVPQLPILKRYLLMFLRFIVLFIVFLLLLNPVWNFFLQETKIEKVIFLQDSSASIDEKKEAFFSEIVPALQKKYEKRGYQVQNHYFSDGLNGAKDKTYLSKTLSELQQEYEMKNIKHIVLCSDGWFQDNNLQEVETLNIPIFSTVPKNKLQYEDLRIENLSHNLQAYIDEANPFIITVAASNYKGEAEVELKIDDKIIESKNCKFDQQNYQEIQFEHTFRTPGLFPIAVEVKSDTLSESNQQNNSIYSAVRVTKNKFNILVLSEKLNWDLKFLKDAINQQQNWNYKIKIAENGKLTLESNDLNETNIVVIINADKLNIQNKELIENYVSSGNAVWNIGKPLSDKIGTTTDRSFASAVKHRITIEEEGQQFINMKLWQAQEEETPPFPYYFVKPKAQSKILASFQNDQHSPAILFNTYNNGKILEFAFEDVWQWQMKIDDSYYNTFVSNILKWLGSDQTDRFIAYPNQNSYIQGENIKIFLQAYDETYAPIQTLDSKVEILDDNGVQVLEKYMSANNGKYEAEFSSQLEEGRYTFQVTENNLNLQAEGEFIVQDSQLEKFQLGFQINTLNYLSKITGGKSLKTAEDLNIEPAKHIIEEKEQQIPLYKKWYVIALFIVCFSLELLLRRKWGLL